MPAVATRRRPKRRPPTPAQRARAAALVEENKAFAAWMVFRVLGLRGDSAEFDDAFQEALWAMWDAAVRFDPTRGFKFVTYAYRAILNRLARHAELSIRYGFVSVGDSKANGDRRRLADKPLSLDAPTSAENGPYRELMPGREPDPAEVVSDDRDQLRAALAKLPARERYVLLARYWGDSTLAQVADRLGVCKERVRQIEERAMDLIRVDLVGGTA